MHVQIIVNPKSGQSRAQGVIRALVDELRRGASVRSDETRHQGHAKSLASHAAERRADAIVVVGGDGTVREAMDGAKGRAPILIVPGGTENILARYLGLERRPWWRPRLRPSDAASLGRWFADVLRNGEIIGFDVGVMNGHPFVLVAGVGFDAEVVRRLSQERLGHITYLDYFWPLWRTFWEHKPPMLFVEVDGEESFRGRGLALVGNVSRYAMGLQLLKRAQPNDGLLDLCVFPWSSRPGLLRHAVRAMVGRHVPAESASKIARMDTFYRQGRQVLIHAEPPADIEVDGDGAGRTPASFELAAFRARFYVPGAARRRNG